MRVTLQDNINIFVKYLKHQKYRMIILAIMMGSGVVIKLLSPQIVRYFIDAVEANASQGVLAIVALVFISTAILGQLIGYGERYISENIGWISTNALKLDLIKHCLNLDMEFHKSHQPGELIERIDGDVSFIFDFFSKFLISILNSVLLMTGILVLLFAEDYRIGISITCFSVIALCVLFFVHSKMKDQWGVDREIQANFYGFLEEHISATEDISTSGSKEYVMNKFFVFLQKMLPVRIKAVMSGVNISMTTFIIYTIGTLISFGVSAYFLYHGTLSLGTVYLIINYTILLNGPIQDIRDQFQTLQKARASLFRIKELQDIQSKLKDGDMELVPNGAIDVKLDNVSFHYEEGSSVLRNVSFHLEKGKVMGILGHTGSGKTTIARLLARFYDATEGQVCFNGVDIRSTTFSSIRREIAYVTQDIQLFNVTVRDNLTLFNETIDDSLIISTIYELGMKEWYEALPHGLNTMMKPGEMGLSGGEAQLLAFIRVFLKNPSLLILDEATSRLDPITEQLVQKALNKLIKGRTCIIIAHRLSTIQSIDCLLLLDNGSIVEFGDRETLEKDEESRYFGLLKRGIEGVLA